MLQSLKSPGSDVHLLKDARTQMIAICTMLCKARLCTLTQSSETLAEALIVKEGVKALQV